MSTILFDRGGLETHFGRINLSSIFLFFSNCIFLGRGGYKEMVLVIRFYNQNHFEITIVRSYNNYYSVIVYCHVFYFWIFSFFYSIEMKGDVPPKDNVEREIEEEEEQRVIIDGDEIFNISELFFLTEDSSINYSEQEEEGGEDDEGGEYEGGGDEEDDEEDEEEDDDQVDYGDHEDGPPRKRAR